MDFVRSFTFPAFGSIIIILSRLLGSELLR